MTFGENLTKIIIKLIYSIKRMRMDNTILKNKSNDRDGWGYLVLQDIYIFTVVKYCSSGRQINGKEH